MNSARIVKFGELCLSCNVIRAPLIGQKFYVGNCTVGGVRKIRTDKLHSAPYPCSSKYVLVVISASTLES